jgi:hypothetical protein
MASLKLKTKKQLEMKKLFIMACTAGMLSFGVAQAQVQDTASTNYNSQRPVEQAGEDVEDAAENTGARVGQAADSTAEDVRQGAENVGNEVQQAADQAGQEVREGADKAGQEVKEEANKVEEKTEDAVQSTDKELDQATQEMEDAWHGSRVDAYIGPNGETVFKKGNKYYYYNADGKRVKIKKRHLDEYSNTAQQK